MISTVIIDDEPKSRSNLQKLLERYCPEVNVEGSVGNIQDAIEEINKIKPELIFLDIEMPEGNGFQLLKHFEHPSFDVVFTTAYLDYAIQALRCSALDYLLKPFDIKELQEAVKRVILKKGKNNWSKTSLESLFSKLKASNEPQTLALPTMEGLQFIPLFRIIRCSASGNYTNFHMEGGNCLLVPKTLKEYDVLLSGMNFIRVHQSHLVNYSHIRRYVKGEGGYLIMSDESLVEVSRRKRTELFDKILI